MVIWQPEFTDKTLSRKTGAVHCDVEPYDLIDKDPGMQMSLSLSLSDRINHRLPRRWFWGDNKYGKKLTFIVNHFHFHFLFKANNNMVSIVHIDTMKDINTTCLNL